MFTAKTNTDKKAQAPRFSSESNADSAAQLKDERPESEKIKNLFASTSLQPVVQRVLDIKSSPKSPITTLKYGDYKALTKKNKDGKPRTNLDEGSWLKLKKMVATKEVMSFNTWYDAGEAAKTYRTKQEIERQKKNQAKDNV